MKRKNDEIHYNSNTEWGREQFAGAEVTVKVSQEELVC